MAQYPNVRMNVKKLQHKENVFHNVKFIGEIVDVVLNVLKNVWMQLEEDNACPNVDNMKETEIVVHQNVSKCVLMQLQEDSVFHNVGNIKETGSAVTLQSLQQLLLLPL